MSPLHLFRESPPLVEQTRNCMAYGLQSGLLRTWEVPGVGRMAYHSTPWGTFVIGDPLAPVQRLEELVERFLASHPGACFVVVSEATAAVLTRLGYYANSFGVETDLLLDEWRCVGKKSHMLRKNSHQAERAGVQVREITHEAAALERCAALSRQWMQSVKRTDVELTLLTRPPCFHKEPQTRKFAAVRGNELVGMAFFDPIETPGSRPGYVYQIIRVAQSAPTGVGTHLLLKVAEQFHSEGVERLSLGLSLLSLPSSELFLHSKFSRFMFHAFRKLTGWMYNYEGQEFYKSRFCGEERVVYFCSRSAIAAREVLVLLKDAELVRAALHSVLNRTPRANEEAIYLPEATPAAGSMEGTIPAASIPHKKAA